jgi:type I restriction enzyme M protein
MCPGDGDEEDLTMDMVRLILAKAKDEENTAPLPEFYCTPEEYRTNEGRRAVADRVQALFREVAQEKGRSKTGDD